MSDGGGTVGYAPIEAYAIIGDCRGAALVARDGSIDWLCWPRFDSPSIFAAILDAERGGCFRIAPVGDAEADRRYIPDTPILETTFTSESGTVILRDLMPVASEEDKRRVLLAEHEILREIEGIDGELELEIRFEPRPNYGQRAPMLEQRGALGIWSKCGGSALSLSGDVSLEISPDQMTATGRVTVRAGERLHLSLSYSQDGPAVIPACGDAARERIARTTAWWQEWAGRARYTGPFRDEVVRSAITLKLLTFAPSGAIVSAPTTSLPEESGGEDNWDYRYCWLRDASLTIRALYGLGYDEEAEAFINWLLHATRLTWPEVRVLYDVYGNHRVPERELDHFQGYGGARPVRIGNEAQGQLQLDVYGEIVDAALQYVEHGGHLDRDTARMLRGLGDVVCRRWREPDSGIWELRDEPRHYTHSKAMCWVALDRLITLHDRYGLDIPVYIYMAERGSIRAEIEQRSFNLRLNAYARTLSGDDLDASVLSLPLYGYVEANNLRMRSTLEQIDRRLGVDGLIYRYLPDDGVPNEGTFGICGFWAVECEARAGDTKVAEQRFRRLLECANDVGLFAEEIDPESGAALGNFPQGFTHIGLINAALALADAAAGKQQNWPDHVARLMREREDELAEIAARTTNVKASS